MNLPFLIDTFRNIKFKEYISQKHGMIMEVNIPTAYIHINKMIKIEVNLREKI